MRRYNHHTGLGTLHTLVGTVVDAVFYALSKVTLVWWLLLIPAGLVGFLVGSIILRPIPAPVIQKEVSGSLNVDVGRAHLTIDTKPNHLALAKRLASKYKKDPNYMLYLIKLADAEAQKYNVPLYVVLSVMGVESSYDADVKPSSANCLGLMQINYEGAWKEKLKTRKIADDASDMYSPERNIEAGCYVLSTYRKESKDWDEALGKYLGLGSSGVEYRAKVYSIYGELSVMDLK